MIDRFFTEGAPANLKDYGLVMPKSARDSLIENQDAYGNPRHRLSPVELTNGQWALNADVLTEAHDGGLFGSVNNLDQDQVALVSVEPWSDVVALLPAPQFEGINE